MGRRGFFPGASLADATKLLDEVDMVSDASIADYQLDVSLLGTDATENLRSRFGPIPACLITANPANGLARTCEERHISLCQNPIDLMKLRVFLSDVGRFRDRAWK